MQEQSSYTIQELFELLPIPLTELSRRCGINEVTLARVRNGERARYSTVNTILLAMSQIFERSLSIRNVTGINTDKRTIDRKTLDPKYIAALEAENAALLAENARLKEAHGITEEDQILQRVTILRHLDRALHELSLLRYARDKEDKANVSRSQPDWEADERFQAKLKEIKEYLHPKGKNGGSWQTGLFPKYIDDTSFECYALISD